MVVGQWKDSDCKDFWKGSENHDFCARESPVLAAALSTRFPSSSSALVQLDLNQNCNILSFHFHFLLNMRFKDRT